MLQFQNSSLFWLSLFLFFSCNNERTLPKEDDFLSYGTLPVTEEFILEKGFQIELIASEPLIEAPVALEFDPAGRIWVVEMPGYMPNIDGIGEDLPSGRISILEDCDWDGTMDERSIFLDSLVLPRAICLVENGLLYATPPLLTFVEIVDDQPGARYVIDSTYAPGGNVEHQANGLLRNIDNFIYNASGKFRYRKIKDKWIKEPTHLRGQWGITHDDMGRLVYNDNSNQLIGDYTIPNQFSPASNLPSTLAQGVLLTTDQSVYPYQATSFNRGYNRFKRDVFDKLKEFTSACGPLIYSGNLFPDEYQNNIFVCGPEANLVKRNITHQEKVGFSSFQAYQGREFLISKDESFRPVNLYNGPDGAMYVLDMRRGIIQHKTYMTLHLRNELISKGLDKVVKKGRIYRISPTHADKQKLPDYSTLKEDELLRLLTHPNGYLRDMAQQMLIDRQAKNVSEGLRKMLTYGQSPLGQIHSLWTLEGLGLLQAKDLLSVDVQDRRVLATVMHLAKMFADEENEAELFQYLIALKDKNLPGTDYQLCLNLGHFKSPEAIEQLILIAKENQDDPLYAEAIVANLKEEHQSLFLKEWLRQTDVKADAPIIQMLETARLNREEGTEEETAIQAMNDVSLGTGLKLYNQHCSVCHGSSGQGKSLQAPPLKGSEFISQNPDILILIALHGLQGPIEVAGQHYDLNAVMPGLKDNALLGYKEIADILNFVRNAFSDDPVKITPALVKSVRERSADQTEMFTAESLKEWENKNWSFENFLESSKRFLKRMIN